jgi:hypothetical protein
MWVYKTLHVALQWPQFANWLDGEWEEQDSSKSNENSKTLFG